MNSGERKSREYLGNAAKCDGCGASGARRYQRVSLVGHQGDESMLCARCARAERKRQNAEQEHGEGLTREEFIGELDRFFAFSGVFDICGRCHEQGTGCCPPTCRVMGAQGCDPDNKYGKTVFCATFICGALLNAISECDAEAGRALKLAKNELGVAEFRIYEMITRVPAEAREPVRPLTLPRRYPRPDGLPADLEEIARVREKLNALADEVLEIRRKWRELEQQEFNDGIRDSR